MSAPVFKWPTHVFPQIRGAGRFPMRPSRGYVYSHPTIALHLHEYHSRTRFGLNHVDLRPGDLTFTLPSEPSEYNLREAGTHLCIHFEPTAQRGTSLELPRHVRLGSFSSAVADRIEQITRHHERAQAERRERPLYQAAASVGLQELLLWLAASLKTISFNSRSQPASEIWDRLKQIIDQNIRRQMAIGELAREVGLSQNYLARRFHIQFGMTLRRYMLNRRASMARHLLSTTTMSVKAVAAEVGIPDVHYFNKQFRAVAGMSPSLYRSHANPNKDPRTK